MTSDLADDDRRRPRLPVRVQPGPLPEPASPAEAPPRSAAPRSAATSPVLTRRLRWTAGIPDTFVGTPAVIASTTSCWVVLLALEDADVTAEPQHGDPVGDLEDVVEVVRDQDDREPCSPRRLTSASTCRVCATPSAAVGSSRITSCEFHMDARATATDWRWPPESVATGCRIELIVVTASDLSVSACAAPSSPRSGAGAGVRLAAEVHVLDDVEVVAQREVLVDDLDPEPGRVLRRRGS